MPLVSHGNPDCCAAVGKRRCSRARYFSVAEFDSQHYFLAKSLLGVCRVGRQRLGRQFIIELTKARSIGVARHRRRRLSEIQIFPTIVQNVRDSLQSIVEHNSQLVASRRASASRPHRYPPMLDRTIDRLFMLRDVAGPSCLQLVRLLLQYNATVDALSQSIVMLGSSQ